MLSSKLTRNLAQIEILCMPAVETEGVNPKPGIDHGADLVETALAAGVLEKSGAHFTFGGKSIGQGRDKTRDSLLTDPPLFEAVKSATLETLPSRAQRAGTKQAA